MEGHLKKRCTKHFAPDIDKGFGFGYDGWSEPELRHLLEIPTDDRIFVIYEARKRGLSIEEIAELSNIDPFFIKKIEKIVRTEEDLSKGEDADLNPEKLRKIVITILMRNIPYINLPLTSM